MLQRSKAVFKGNNDNIPYICDQFYTFILHDKSHNSHGILQFLQSHFICSLIWHDGYRVKEFTRSETRTKSVVTLAWSAVKH